MKVLELLREAVDDTDAYIVGGAVRDGFLGRMPEDIDVSVTEHGISHFIQTISSITGARVVVLGERKKPLYMISPKGMPRIDITILDVDIHMDLARRDFTMNAMAIDIKSGVFLDPFGGMNDIQDKIVRMVSTSGFEADPLRIVRMYRFSAVLNFEIDEHTKMWALMSTDALRGVSMERLRDELFRILSIGASWKVISSMENDCVLQRLFPVVKYMVGVKQGRYHHLDVWGHSLLSLRILEETLSSTRGSLIHPEVVDYLDCKLVGGRKRGQLLKLAVLFHDVGKPFTMKVSQGEIHFWGHQDVGAHIIRKIAAKLRFSGEEQMFLSKLVFWHMFPIFLLKLHKKGKDYERHLNRFLTMVGEDVIGVFLLSYADLSASRGPLSDKDDLNVLLDIAQNTIDYYFIKVKDVYVNPPLLNGYEIMRVLNIPPGPVVGRIKDELRMVQLSGIISSKDEALRWLKKNYGERSD